MQFNGGDSLLVGAIRSNFCMFENNRESWFYE